MKGGDAMMVAQHKATFDALMPLSIGFPFFLRYFFDSDLTSIDRLIDRHSTQD
jgi:hypothetical protein